MDVCLVKVKPIMQSKLSRILTAQAEIKLLKKRGVEFKYRCRWQQPVGLVTGVAGPWQRWVPLGWGPHPGPKPLL